MSLKNVVNIHCIPLNFIVKMFLKRKKKKTMVVPGHWQIAQNPNHDSIIQASI